MVLMESCFGIWTALYLLIAQELPNFVCASTAATANAPSHALDYAYMGADTHRNRRRNKHISVFSFSFSDSPPYPKTHALITTTFFLHILNWRYPVLQKISYQSTSSLCKMNPFEWRKSRKCQRDPEAGQTSKISTFSGCTHSQTTLQPNSLSLFLANCGCLCKSMRKREFHFRIFSAHFPSLSWAMIQDIAKSNMISLYFAVLNFQEFAWLFELT